ncbi:MAG: VWA domain-containing protein [Myxococcales bacterium]
MAEALDDLRGGTARRSLRFVMLVDVSGSMSGDKIQAVNRAVRECIPEMRKNNRDNPFAEMTVEVITFSTGAVWHVPKTPVEQFNWKDLGAEGVTDLGAAVNLVTEALDVQNMGKRNLPPVLLLLSDGGPTDDWELALRRFEATPWGKPGRTVRIAVAIGEGADKGVLARFTGNPETVLSADKASALVSLIKWASISVTKSHSASMAVAAGGGPAPAPLPPPPVVVASKDDDDAPW